LKKIIIVGAGGFGREVYSWLTHHEEYNRKWNIKGFLDDVKAGGNVSPNDPINNYPVKVLNSIDKYIPEKNDLFIVAVGEPKSKETIIKRLNEKGVNYYNLIHPTVIISSNVRLGKGCIICPNVTISCDAEIGDFVALNVYSSVGHDAKIGDYSTICGHVDITGHCVVGKGVFMGTHSALIPKTVVGDYANISAGTIGIRKVKAHSTILGVPGKRFEIKTT
jgi:sugar O-acyltransferase (sialic acid O-acetyltransferase NeuD family)